MPIGSSSWRPRDPSAPPPDSNPFATRYVRPGALPYLFPAGTDAAALVARLRRHGWWGQITGPHGSGKSTLLQTLLPPLEDAGRRIALYELHPGATRLSAAREPPGSWDDRTQVVIDGYELLGWLPRLWLRRTCAARHAGLLVTAHRRRGLPEIWQTEVTFELASRVVGLLTAGWTGPAVSADAVAQAFAAHPGNLREMLFALYDCYETRPGESADCEGARSSAVRIEDRFDVAGPVQHTNNRDSVGNRPVEDYVPASRKAP